MNYSKRYGLQHLSSIDMGRANNQKGAYEVYYDQKGSERASMGMFNTKRDAKLFLAGLRKR